DGLVHVSELADRRVAKVTDIVNVGDVVQVKVLGFDDRGKIKLSMKAVPGYSSEVVAIQQEAVGA
ncbi:MAG: S1 RNA-binding domain-containing protein, partial [Alphaproteobacteria bacterium]|nr:S1 RNA-binding domain-containing protein [Alphaproteobacteria bacterium]